MQQDVLDLDIPVRNRWLLVVHLKQASAGILHDVHNLLLAETFASEPYNQVEQSAFCAELADNTNLMHSWRSLLDLGLVNSDNVLMVTDLPPDLHLICNQLTLLFSLRIDLFKRILLARLRVRHCIYESKATF